MNGVLGNLDMKQDYEQLLTQMASTDTADAEWGELRDAIRYRISHNVELYMSQAVQLSGQSAAEDDPPASNFTSTKSPAPLTNASTPLPSTNGGLILPPFPPRRSNPDSLCCTLPSQMTAQEASEMSLQVLSLLNDFDGPPFTIQRICQLCLQPDKHYKSVGKYLRAIERSLLVTSTLAMFPRSDPSDEEYRVNPALASSSTLRDATTPLFSPIPFLHDDARSRSPSPISIPPLRSEVGTTLEVGLGLVDELDDPKPGHLSDNPRSLTMVTTPRDLLAIPLGERFTKERDASSDFFPHGRPPGDTALRNQEEDQEVEKMVLEGPENANN